jgi:non-specific serine/threonine protein kinase
MGAAGALARSVAASVVVLPHLAVFHDEFERRTRAELGAEEFEAARREGDALNFDEAVAYATGETAS